jgi:hypothetical protein
MELDRLTVRHDPDLAQVSQVWGGTPGKFLLKIRVHTRPSEVNSQRPPGQAHARVR